MKRLTPKILVGLSAIMAATSAVALEMGTDRTFSKNEGTLKTATYEDLVQALEDNIARLKSILDCNYDGLAYAGGACNNLAQANTANEAETADYAEDALDAEFAEEAGRSETSITATSADTASLAYQANSATYASVVDSATSSDKANTATSAGKANSADTASSATNAKKADYSTEADYSSKTGQGFGYARPHKTKSVNKSCSRSKMSSCNFNLFDYIPDNAVNIYVRSKFTGLDTKNKTFTYPYKSGIKTNCGEGTRSGNKALYCYASMSSSGKVSYSYKSKNTVTNLKVTNIVIHYYLPVIK